MRLLLRLVAIVTALSLAGSSSLSAMPLVWCFGKDGHRAVEAMLHQHGIEATDAFADAGIPTGTDDAPCLDWQLLNAAGTPLAKGSSRGAQGAGGPRLGLSATQNRCRCIISPQWQTPRNLTAA